MPATRPGGSACRTTMYTQEISVQAVEDYPSRPALRFIWSMSPHYVVRRSRRCAQREDESPGALCVRDKSRGAFGGAIRYGERLQARPPRHGKRRAEKSGSTALLQATAPPEIGRSDLPFSLHGRRHTERGIKRELSAAGFYTLNDLPANSPEPAKIIEQALDLHPSKLRSCVGFQVFRFCPHPSHPPATCCTS